MDSKSDPIDARMLLALTGREIVVPGHMLDFSVSRFSCELLQPILGVPAPFIEIQVLSMNHNDNAVSEDQIHDAQENLNHPKLDFFDTDTTVRQ